MMLRRHAPAFLVAVLLLVAVRAQAQWSSWIDYSGQCQTGGFWTCASVQVYTLNIPTGTYVEIRVRNLMPGNTVINGWEIYERRPGQWGVGCCGPFPRGFHTTPGPQGSVEQIGPDPMGYVDMSNGSGRFDADGHYLFNLYGWFDFAGGGGVVGCENNLPVPINDITGNPTGYYRTCPSQGYTGWWGWTLTIDTRVKADAFVVGSIGGHDYGTPPPAVTPEPVTMTLLATGLAGVGGAAWRRRKSKGDVEE